MSFTDILNLSISASWLVLAVMAARLVLKQAPKALHCALWALVAIRLICPISIESSMSLIPSREVVPREYLRMEPGDREFSQPASLEIITNPVYDAHLSIEIEPTVDRVQHWDMIGTVIWLAGMGAMGIYAAYSYLSLRLRVRMAIRTDRRVFECDEVDTPFILGLLRPRIYLPSGMDDSTRTHVLAHENAHLKRLDHIWKPLGFALLAVHWFNPLLWLAYALLCRDIELACDEKVIRKLDRTAVRAYSESLVRCSVSHRSVALCPLAFGEIGVKGRIRAMTRYKKPGLILTAAVMSVSAVLAACFLTDPPEVPPESVETAGRTLHFWDEPGLAVSETVHTELDLMFYIDWLPEACFTPEGYTFREDELILYESETTILETARVIPEGDLLRFDFRFRYDLPGAGTALLPCHITIKGDDYSMGLTGIVYDYTRDYTGGVTLVQEPDTLEFTLLIDRALVENADDYLSVGLQGLWETTFVPEGMSIQGRYLHVAQVLYQNKALTLSGSAAYAPSYIVGQDLHLTALEVGSRWEIRRDMGALTPLALTESNFDGLFPGSVDPAALREDNLCSWLCGDGDQRHMLLQQQDGSLYLAVIRQEGTVLSDFYRLQPGEYEEPTPEVIGRSFSLDVTDSFDIPGFTLYSDGTFRFTQSVTSSYLGYGSYLLEEDSLVMQTSDGLYTWTFLPEGNAFRFDAAHSSPVSYFRSLPDEFVTLTDGAIFSSGNTAPETGSTLEEILSEAILENNFQAEDEGLICVENHEILGELTACGVATADGGAPLEILTVYLGGEYRTYNSSLTYQRFQRFCAAITLESSDSGYTVTNYSQTGFKPKDAESIFPEHVQALFDERKDIIRSRSSQENRDDAQLLLCRSMGQETDIAALIDTICSSPAQSSNPGDYIAAHQAEFDRLVDLGTHTVRYCFAEFARGDQIGLPGHIMALACRQIIPDRTDAHEIPDEICMTGQDWFDQFAATAETHRSEMSLLEFEEKHPFCFLALQALGI